MKESICNNLIPLYITITIQKTHFKQKLTQHNVVAVPRYVARPDLHHFIEATEKENNKLQTINNASLSTVHDLNGEKNIVIPRLLYIIHNYISGHNGHYKQKLYFKRVVSV